MHAHAEPLPLSQPAVSKHVKVLERAGLIERSHVEQTRPCRLRADPLREVARFADDFGQWWDESFERLDELLAREKTARKGRRPYGGRPLAPSTDLPPHRLRPPRIDRLRSREGLCGFGVAADGVKEERLIPPRIEE